MVLPIASEIDVYGATRYTRHLALNLGFNEADQVRIETVILELGRNIVQHAGHGEIVIRVVSRQDRLGLQVRALDRGPGIPDIELALQDGYSTSGSLGMGLGATRRLMDEFSIESGAGRGTSVTATKWVPERRPDAGRE
ncbi:MAG: anti-sigma regulatory factor [Chloroflexi bacterium]|nr:anti-sigma regulatory factor [Chloroflexota bacterium]MBU1748483.1 anti-sigma regulatory factor [Chloroflexota bacterium]